jgi:hypothetical protein
VDLDGTLSGGGKHYSLDENCLISYNMSTEIPTLTYSVQIDDNVCPGPQTYSI